MADFFTFMLSTPLLSAVGTLKNPPILKYAKLQISLRITRISYFEKYKSFLFLEKYKDFFYSFKNTREEPWKLKNVSVGKYKKSYLKRWNKNLPRKTVSFPLLPAFAVFLLFFIWYMMLLHTFWYATFSNEETQGIFSLKTTR